MARCRRRSRISRRRRLSVGLASSVTAPLASRARRSRSASSAKRGRASVIVATLGARLARAPTVGAELGARVENGNDLDHLGAVEHAALGTTARQDRADVGERFQRERASGGERQARLAGHLDRCLDFGEVGERLGCRCPIASHLSRSFVSQERPHRVPFGAGLPDSACLQPSPHSLPSRVTGVPACIKRCPG